MTKIQKSNTFSRAGLMIILLIIAGFIAMFWALKFASSEEEREKIIWQNRMSVVVNGRVDVVSKWVEQQRSFIQDLSANPTLRLYFSNLSTDLGLEESGQVAMHEYIQPLLTDRAIQNGFVAPIENSGADIKANVERVRHAGIAISNLEGKIVVATANMPSVLEAVSSYISSGANQDTMIVGPYEGESGLPTVALIAPVYGIDEGEGDNALGFLIGVKVLGGSFFDLLVQPGEITETARNYLVRRNDNLVTYINQTAKTSSTYIVPMDVSSPQLASSFVLDNPGLMGEKVDYAGENVLVSGDKVSGTDWHLVRTIAAKEALGQAAGRKRNIIFMSMLIIIGLGISLILIWRHGVSVRLQEAVTRQKELTSKFEELSKFMTVVTDSQPTAISAVDEKGEFTFVNLQTATAAKSNSEDMIGKKPSAIFGNAVARIDEMNCQEVLASDKPLTKIQESHNNDNKSIIKTDYLPLIGAEDGKQNGVLMVKEDITELEQNRIRRELGFKSLISTLTRIIGSRDPYSAAHSERVVEVTKVLCKELDTDDVTASTAELAGAMMNLGKIMVPREILTKPANLTDEELEIIRTSMLKSADLIRNIEFEGPVCETLEHIQAHWDGSGQPEGLSGEDILLPARIVSVANAFVGMVSARAHREGMPMSKATKILMDESEKIYDRHPVIALMNFIENKDGDKEWQHFLNKPENI